MIIQTVGPEPEPEAMGKACAIAARWEGCNATIYVEARDPKTGWLEYGVEIVKPDNTRAIFIGLIQRTFGAAWESHS